MKTIKLFIAVLLMVNAVFAQKQLNPLQDFKSPSKQKENTGAVTIQGNKSSEQTGIRIETVKGSFSFDVSKYNLTQQQIEGNLINYLSLNNKHKFVKLNQTEEESGFIHINYQQLYNNIPVDGAMVMLHLKNGKPNSLNGQIAIIKNLSTTAAINADTALQKAKEYTKAKELIKTYPIQLLIAQIPTENGFIQKLAYKIRIDVSLGKKENVFVDAITGKVLNAISLISDADVTATANTLYSGTQTITTDSYAGGYRLRDNARNIETYDATNSSIPISGISNPAYNGYSDYFNTNTVWPPTNTANKLFSFTDSAESNTWWSDGFDITPDLYIKLYDGSNILVYNGRNNRKSQTNPPVTFSLPNPTYLTNPPYRVELWDYDLIGSDDFGGSYSITTNKGRNSWFGNVNYGSYFVTSDKPALDIHWGLEKTYDFYKNVFKRNSYDGNGSVIRGYFNPPDLQDGTNRGISNAFGIDNQVRFGSGDYAYTKEWVSLDIVGHEFTHLVIDNTGSGGLVYQGESGALNESFADIFGTCIEFYAKPSNANWVIGEDFMLPPFDFLRSLRKPKNAGQPNTYNGAYWENPICGTSTDINDNCGVHTNSGVQNYWFYLLSQGGSGTNDNGYNYNVTGIGIDKAKWIAYRNLIYYLTPNATYQDAYNGSLQVAKDMFGFPSAEYTAVQAAWNAVGLGVTSSSFCNSTTYLSNSSGVITDGSGNANYNDNSNCKWVIAPPGADSIKITFTSFSTEANFDSISIYEGKDTLPSSLINKKGYSGTNIPPSITSKAGAVTIRFTSDYSNTSAGWSLNYTTYGKTPTCNGGNVLTAQNGSFNDGSGASNYTNNQNCFWSINPPCATSVTLNFTQFNTESGYDFVRIYDGATFNLLGSYSGSVLPTPITSTSGKMYVEFASDYIINYPGFSANYTSNVLTPTTNTTNLNGCNSVTYKTKVYTSSTVVRDTVRTTQGCDSIYNLANITVRVITPTTNTTNLSGCNSITYKTKVYTASTIVRDTVKSYQGCDSIYNIANITVRVITPTTNTTNFSGCNSVTYKTKVYTASAVVRDTVKSIQGCDSIYNVANITVRVIAPTTNTTSLSGCNSVTYKTKVYTASTIVRDTVKSVQGCDSIYNVANIIINNSSVSNTTVTIAITDLPYTWNGISYTSTGTYSKTFIGGNSKGCDSTATLTLLISSEITANSQWTWVSGDSTKNQLGVYGTKGIAAASNKPGGRSSSVSWTDASGNLWLFGGNGYSASGSGNLNDLWKYNTITGQWTWLSGDNTPNQYGVYGNKGIAATSNKPGARQSSVSWTDASGNLWLFGGIGYAESGGNRSLNDLWKYNTTTGQWTWVSGDSTISTTDQYGVYGTKGIAAASNKPGARFGSVCWTDTSGNLWLFGGSGAAASLGGYLNDLWKYNTSTGQWTWVSGDNTPNQYGVYGNKGLAAVSNKPRARDNSFSWTDASGNLWLFGGRVNESGWYGYSNDLWKYNTSAGQWTWVSGDSTTNQLGVYGSKGKAAASNKPGARYGRISWTDASGSLWMFSGNGYAASGSAKNLNDLWKYNTSAGQWTWVSGDSTTDQLGVYGTQGTAAASNKPGARTSGVSFADAIGNVRLFGGWGRAASVTGTLNDLWKIAPICSGSNTTQTACGSYFWNGVTYTTSGVYTKTFTGAGGCDSLATLNLTITTPTTNTTNLSGCNSVTYKTKVFTASTIVRDTVKSLQGCDSVYNVANINIKLPTTSTTNITIYATALPYLWNGLTFTSAGSQTYHTTNSQGCDSAATLNLTVRATATIHTVFLDSVNTTCSQNTVSIPLKVKNFRNVVGVQGTIKYDTSKLQFSSYNLNSSSTLSSSNWSFNSGNANSKGEFTLIYTNVNTSLTLLDSTTLFTLNFIKKSGLSVNSKTTLQFSNTPTLLSIDTATDLAGLSDLATLTPPYSIFTGGVIVNNNSNSANVITQNLFGCNSVTYKSKVYTVSTLVRDTVRTIQGCDSIYNVVNISVRVITPTTNTTSLNGCNSVTYKTKVYTTSTVVRDTVKSYQGCDSIYNVANITVRVITPTTNTTNLNGCNSVTYKTKVYTASTVVRDTVKSYQGCDSVYNVANITVRVITPTTNTTNLSGCNSVTYKTKVYTASTIVRDTVKSIQGCDSIYNLANITVSLITPTTNTTNLSGCNSVIYKTKVYTASTVVRDTVKSYQGCDSIYNVHNIVVTPIIATTNNFNHTGCNKVVYLGTTYTSSTIVRDTVKSYQGCDSIYNVHNIVVTPVIATTKSFNHTGCNKVVYLGTTYTSSTIVRDTVKSYQGCDSVYNIHNIVVTPVIATTKSFNHTGCNKVVYLGTTYTNSTIVRDTVKSYQGCDSVYNVHNIVITPITATTKSFNHTGCNKVVYLGTTYTSSTVVRDTVKSYQGCDSIYNVHNIVVTPVIATTKSFNHTGCNKFVYLGTTYTSSTIVRDTVKSYQGCDSVYNVHNIVVTPITATTTNFNHTGCNKVVYLGTTYTSSTVVRDTVKSYQGCDSIYNVHNIVVTPVIATTKSFAHTGCNKVVYLGTTYTSSTTVRDTVKSYQGCDSVYNVHNIVVTPITATTKSFNHTGCNKVVYLGTTYTSSTIVRDTVKSYQGCDSIYNVHNIVVTPVIATTKSFNHTGCNKVVYLGTTYTSSTIVRDTVKSYQGCDSIYNIHNIVVTPVIATTKSFAHTGCNKVVYLGTTYTSSTVVRDTVKSYQGCDSIYNIHNIVVTPITATTKSFNHTGCNKVVYLGTTYTSSTIVKDTVKSYQGCDSVYNVHNIVVTPIIATTKSFAHTGCNKVVYLGTTYTSSTIVRDTVKSYQGCDSVYNVHNIVVTPVIATTTNFNHTGCNKVVYLGTTYTSSTVVRDTVKSYQGCDSIYNIHNIVVTPITATTTNFNHTGCNKVVYLGTTYTSSTIVRDTVKSYQGCDSVYNVHNIVVTPITATTTNFNHTGCNKVVYLGTTYTSSTVVRDTVKSYQGCDSIYIVHNIVVTPVIATTKSFNHTGCNKVVYLGTTYTTSTIVRDTVKSYQGCDSVYNIHNIVVTPVIATTKSFAHIGCNKVVYLGTTYTTSTVVRDTVKSYQGCDSIYNIHKIVVTPIIATTKSFNHTGCNKVVYLGTTYTSSTIVRDTVKSYQGCDSIYNVHNIVVTPVIATTKSFNHTGCNKVVYLGTTYTSSTIVRDTVKSYQGCDSIYNVHNIVVTPVIATTTNFNHTGCNKVVYLGTTYTSSTIVRDTVKSYQGCDSIYNVANITVTPVTATTNTINLSGCPTIVYKGITYTASTTIRDTVKSYQGCDSIYNVAVLTISNNSILGNLVRPNGTTLNLLLPATVNVSGTVNQSVPTGINNYEINCFPFNANGAIKLYKNNDVNKANGISTTDVLLVQRHILNTTKLNSAYKLIAADVNGDKQINTTDVLRIKRLILATDTTFTKGSGVNKVDRLWEFVDSAYTFPDTTNPYPFKDSISFNNLTSNKINQTFIGVKLGDVNYDWSPTSARVSHYYPNEPLVLSYHGNILKSTTNEIRIPISVKNFKRMLGMQYTLNYDNKQLEFVGVISKRLNIDYASHDNGKVSFLWADKNNQEQTFEDGTEVFDLIFKTHSSVGFTDLRISSDITDIESLDGDYEKHNVALQRSDSYLVIEREGMLLTPNPTTDKNVKVGISVKRDKRVSIQVSDANGRLLFTQDVSCKRGMNTYQLLPSNLSLLSKGMYIVQAIGLDEDNISRLIVQ